jgi:hypothetical protein
MHGMQVPFFALYSPLLYNDCVLHFGTPRLTILRRESARCAGTRERRRS